MNLMSVYGVVSEEMKLGKKDDLVHCAIVDERAQVEGEEEEA